MCGVAAAVAGAAGLLASGLLGGGGSAPEPPAVQTYTAPKQNLNVDKPPVPAGTPTFGHKSPEEMQKDATTAAAKKNKTGRAALRIDLDPNTALPGAGQVSSGTVVPRG